MPHKDIYITGGDPGVINQKTLTTVLLTPEGRFHSVGFTARDHYHDLDPEEAKRWRYFDKFKMTLHHKYVIKLNCIHFPTYLPILFQIMASHVRISAKTQLLRLPMEQSCQLSRYLPMR